ncbi:Sorting nexin-15 [Halocaridina rubra]|uniref:Sorting nexin-15 n=1 Tax=Halocaridina rubra TaxID=373956 RepID=A0AAN8ZXU8_HALRR
MAAKLDPWVRIFEVPETKKHSKGYTIYQVKSTVFPRSSPEASTSVVVWRRYSELRRLHKAISELHQKLGITDQLPPFPRATILNRFDADVVETRREAALNLLKFIGQHNSLFTSEPFTKFFENDENANINKKPRSTSKPKNSKGRSKEAEHLASTLGIQGLSSLYSQMSDTDDDFSICSSLDSPVSPVPDAPLFQTENEMECANDPHDVTFTKNGEENIINHLSNVYEDLQKSKQSESSTHNSMLEQNNQMPYSQYDTIKHLQEKSGFKQSSSKNTCDVSWNFMYDNDFKDDVFSADTALPSIAKKERDHSQSERHPSTSSLSSISSQPCCVYENPVHDSPQKAYLAEEVLSSHTSSTQAEKFVPFIPPIDVSRKMSIGGRKNSVPLTPLTPLTQTVLPVLIPKNKVPSPQEVACSQYIFVAAQQISEAQHHEQQKDYKQALTMYREGVGTLLQGVQGKY